MRRLADPSRCPDCAQTISTGSVSCPACALPLRGETAQRLFLTLRDADDLLARLRSERARVLVHAGGSADGSAGGSVHRSVEPGEAWAAPTAGAADASSAGPALTDAAGRGRGGLSAASVPRILLGLGVACLLVAALVFLAVTWALLGVGGRTAVLLGLTVAAGIATGVVARRSLRGAAESFALVTLGVAALDVTGARSAGWLGDLSGSGLVTALGTVLLTGGAVAAVLVRRATPLAGLLGAELVAGLGVALVALGLATTDGVSGSAAPVVVMAVAGVGAALAHRCALRRTRAVGVALVAAGWSGLVAMGLLRAVAEPSYAALLLGLQGWPLALAAVTALAPWVPRGSGHPSRLAGAATAATLLAGLALAPAYDESATVVLLALAAAVTCASVPMVTAPVGWRLLGAPVQALTGLAVVSGLTVTLAPAAGRLLTSSSALWSGATGDRLPTLVTGPGLAAPWAAIPALAGLAGLLLALASAGAEPVRGPARAGLPPLLAGLAVGVTTLVTASYAVPVGLAMALPAAGTLALTGWWLRRPSRLLVALASALGMLTLGVGLHAPLLTALAATLVLVGATAVHLRASVDSVAFVAGVVAAAATGLLVWTSLQLGGVGPSWRGVVVIAAVALPALLGHLAPGRLWRSTAATARTGVEAGAIVVAVPVAVAGTLLAPTGTGLTWTAGYLTLTGALLLAHAQLRPDRAMVAPAGTLLLLAASWVRLGDLGVREPEAYTLPAAAVLAVTGLLRLRRDPEASTSGALGPALGLALVPTLLWTLVEPAGVRALALGLACLALVVAGAWGRWTAPLLWGAAVGGALVARLGVPYVGSAVPRWVVVGGAGLLLVTLGTTWERRLTEARRVAGYVRALR